MSQYPRHPVEIGGIVLAFVAGIVLVMVVLAAFLGDYRSDTDIANERCIELADGNAWRRFSIEVGKGPDGHVCHVTLPSGEVKEYVVG